VREILRRDASVLFESGPVARLDLSNLSVKLARWTDDLPEV